MTTVTTATMRPFTAWSVWTVAVAFVVYLFGIQTAYSIVSPRVQEDLGLSVRQVGLVAALYTWVFAFCQLFSGALLDRLGCRRVLPIAIGLVTVGVFVYASAASYEVILVSQAILALGACFGFVGAGYVGGQWFGMARFSFMFGLVQFAAALSSAFNQNIIAAGLNHATWRELLGYAGALGIALLVVGVMVIRDPVPVKVDQRLGIRTFVVGIARDVGRIGRIPHIWAAAVFGAISFGAILALGVAWGPMLLGVRGAETTVANQGASLIWLGLAAGCLALPKWSDTTMCRKRPILLALGLQLAALALLLYGPAFGPVVAMALFFAFGLGGAAHVLAFSTAADVVAPGNIGTSAAIVNGLMFLVGGVMIARPGVRVGWGVESGLAPRSLELARFAAWPLVAALIVAFAVALLMKETYPSSDRR
jgi:MFS family permease